MGLVGLVVPELTNPVFPVYVQVIEAALVRASYTPVLGTGHDDSPLVTDPPSSTVRQPVREMGVAAVRALLDDIAGTPVQRGELLFQPELVLRASTAPASVATV